jgi:L-lactate dehydrogenase complex protein LldE
MKVALFVTCFNDLLFPHVGRAVVTLLERLGHEVDFPPGQTCCGQMHFNSGYRDACVPLVRRFHKVFDRYDAVVTPSASCAAMVRIHHRVVAKEIADDGLLGAADTVAPRVHELTEFLIDILGTVDVGARFPHSVALHPTCHSLRLLRLGNRPERLLDAVDGLTRVDLAHADECCGFGGTFAVKNAATSVAMGVDKLAEIEASGASVLTSADTSCLMHLGGLLSRRGSPVRVMHLAEILASTEAIA